MLKKSEEEGFSFGENHLTSKKPSQKGEVDENSSYNHHDQAEKFPGKKESKHIFYAFFSKNIFLNQAKKEDNTLMHISYEFCSIY